MRQFHGANLTPLDAVVSEGLAEAGKQKKFYIFINTLRPFLYSVWV
jgi:hypothetical protein